MVIKELQINDVCDILWGRSGTARVRLLERSEPDAKMVNVEFLWEEDGSGVNPGSRQWISENTVVVKKR